MPQKALRPQHDIFKLTQGRRVEENWDVKVLKGATSLPSPMTERCIPTQTLDLFIYLPSEHLEGPLPQTPLRRKTPRLSSTTHTRTKAHREHNPTPHHTPHCCTILAKLNHSLMGGLTERYGYSLWGLAMHTNRRLCGSHCQQTRLGYLQAFKGMEWDPTGKDLPCPLGS